MGVEAFAEAALCLLPGWHVEAMDDVNFLAPFKFYRNEPRTVTTQTLIYSRGDDAAFADCQLTGCRTLPNQPEPQVTTHFTGRVRLTRQLGHPAPAARFTKPSGSAIEAADIYRVYFHGPAYRVVERAWWDGNRMVGLMATKLGKNHDPAELPTLMAPRLIELCFQTAGLWQLAVHGQMGLPQHIDQVRVWRASDLAKGPLYAIVTPSLQQGSFDAEVVDTAGNCYVNLSAYRTVEVPVDAEAVTALQAVMLLEPATV
jgi:hypothetical protein